MKTVVIGLGNTVLSDDGLGIFAARSIAEKLEGSGVRVVEAETAGFDLIEMLRGSERAVIVDSIFLDGVEPGTVFRLNPDDMKITPRLASCHDIDLVTAIALGKKMGLVMPDDVTVFAVQGEDVLTLHEGCLEKVSNIMPGLVREICGFVTGTAYTRISIPLRERSGPDA